MRNIKLGDLLELSDKELSDLVKAGVFSYQDEILKTGKTNQSGLIQMSDCTIRINILGKVLKDEE